MITVSFHNRKKGRNPSRERERERLNAHNAYCFIHAISSNCCIHLPIPCVFDGLNFISYYEIEIKHVQNVCLSNSNKSDFKTCLMLLCSRQVIVIQETSLFLLRNNHFFYLTNDGRYSQAEFTFRLQKSILYCI